MRTRDAWAIAAALFALAFALVLLFSSFGGGMMGSMMGGMMVGFLAAGLVILLAIVFLVLAVISNRLSPAPPLAAPPPTTGSPPVTSEVEAAVVRFLDEDERLLYLRVRDAGGEVLQRDIVAWGTFSPAKVTRLLDRLEARSLLVRERYGMTNRIRLRRQPAISGK